MLALDSLVNLYNGAVAIILLVISLSVYRAFFNSLSKKPLPHVSGAISTLVL